MTKKSSSGVKTYGLQPGRLLADKYEVVSLLGSGYEGEVYKVREKLTKIERAAKFFFPERNFRNCAIKFYARKLNKLRNCPIVIQYHAQEKIIFRRQPLPFLISDFVEGELLSEFCARQPGKRLSPYEGLHLLHALAAGVEGIHKLGEYHGDLHDENIIVKRRGLQFEVKLLDMYRVNGSSAQRIHDDVCNLIRIAYDAMGGARRYAKHPPAVKRVLCGLKRSLIIRKFRDAGQLRTYLETMDWDV